MNDLIKTRNLFRESADILDEILEIEKKEAADKETEREILLGRFAIKMIELQSL